MAATLPEYQALEPLGGERLSLRFSGPFDGREIRWDATFVTLAHYRLQHAPDATTLQNFIDIGAEGPYGRELTVALNVVRFDAPTVAKAIIMVRQYKRLHVGRHAFGTPHRFTE